MKTKYDWSNVPKEIMWIATDSDKFACGYSEPVCISTGEFLSESGEGDICIIYTPETNTFKGDWQDSLEERPNEFN